MNREAIEKAADSYANDIPQSDERREYSREDFMAGAEWSINSAWHYIDNELPECGQHIVNEDWFDFIAKGEKDLQRIIKKYPFRLWAYVSDLLPDGKENER